MIRNEHEIDHVRSAIASVSDKLFVFHNLAGDIFFNRYDTNGAPTVLELMFIFHRGATRFCTMLDGGCLPTDGVHILEDGWGMAVVLVPRDHDPGRLIELVKATARHLAATMEHEHLQYSRLFTYRVLASITLAIAHMRKRIAAFKAA